MANYEDLGFVPAKQKAVAAAPAADYSHLGFVAKKEGYGEPGVAGMGTLPPDESMVSSAIHKGAQGLGALGKILDAPRGLLTAPLLGSLLEKATGKQVYSSQDVLNAVNPTNLNKFPSASEMYEKAGVPEGAKLSDYVGGFAKPSPANPWYQPEKGGALDITLRGAGGFGTDVAIDPLTYATMGLSKAAKTALNADVVTQAMKGGGKNAAENVLKMVAENAPKGLEMGPYASAAMVPATPASSALKTLGKMMYSAPLERVEAQGLKYGKRDVGDVFYKAGVKAGGNLPENAKTIKSALINARNAIGKVAEEKGAEVSTENAMRPAEEMVAKLRSNRNHRVRNVGDALAEEVALFKNENKGVEAIPESVQKIATGLVDEAGNPIMREVKVPGVAAIPGKPITPNEAFDVTSSLYDGVPTGKWEAAAKTSAGEQGDKALASGYRQATLDSIGEAFSPKAANAAEQLNAATGKLLSTGKSQVTAANQINRLKNSMGAPTGFDSILANLGGAGAFLKNKLGYGARYLSMPAGYYTRKLGESPVPAAALDAYTRRKIIEMFDKEGK